MTSLRHALLEVVQPVEKTRWCFLAIETADGYRGIGEATLQSHEDAVFAVAEPLLVERLGQPAEPALASGHPRPRSLPEAAVLSALSQALWDVAGQRAGRPACDLMGERLRQEVPLYANINRRTVARTPEAFAESARAALADGFEAFKLAPFDEITPALSSAGREGDWLAPGLARIAAVRDAIGHDRDLMVDCHWRFSPAGARLALDAVSVFGLHWFECPLPETDELIPEIIALRRRANARGMLLAGCETEIGVAGFERFIAAGAYDVVMPDIKYVGSMDEMLALAERLEGTGTQFSPHNPSGPVSHAASLMLAAVAPGFTRLEMQYDETPLFWQIVTPPLPRPAGGASALPQGLGLGIRLDPDRIAPVRVRSALYV